MKITYRGDYALKAILDLALNSGKLITIHDLAKHTDIPVKFLEQVLLDLKQGGFVESKRGKIGGYLLAKHPSQIKLGEVIRFIDGPIEPIGCVGAKYSGCADTYSCVFRKVWSQVAQATSAIVDHITFEDLASQTTQSKQELIYNI